MAYIPATQVEVDSVDLSAFVITASLVFETESQDITTQADTSRQNGPGLQSNTIEIEFQLDPAVSGLTQTLEDLVGTTTTVVLIPTAGAVSSSNRRYTVVGAYLSSFQSIGGSLGSIATASAVFTGGDRAIANS